MTKKVGVKRPLVVVAVVVAVGTAACSKSSDQASKATATTASSAPAGGTPPSAASSSGPVTEADVTDVDQILHRLDTELDRLDSDLGVGEGQVQ
jgi:hypothetical protein